MDTKDPNWMDEARNLAAQCWRDKETEDRAMDVVLAEAFAKRIAVLMDTATILQQKIDFYYGLIARCGDVFTEPDEDGPLCSNVPGLVEELRAKYEELKERIAP